MSARQTTITVRPSSDISNGGANVSTTPLSTPISTVTSDNNDGTYAFGHSAAVVSVHLGAGTIPAGRRVVSLTPRQRAADTDSFGTEIDTIVGYWTGSAIVNLAKSPLAPAYGTVASTPANLTATTYTGVAAPYSPRGGRINPADVTGANLTLSSTYNSGASAAGANLIELYLDVTYDEGTYPLVPRRRGLVLRGGRRS